MDLEISHDTELKEPCDNSSEFGEPHEALFLVLSYLPLFELLAMSEVCRSLRDALNKDILPWLNIRVQEEDSRSRLSDDILMRITSKAKGRLRTLVLENCVKITDDGLQAVIAKNPHIFKLEVPKCTSLTPEGIVKAATTLNLHNLTLKKLKINGIYNITKEHLETLHVLLRTKASREEDGEPSSIDVEICPKCDEVRMVFDCPSDACERKRMSQECRGCKFCIQRCEECGRCVGFAEEQETAAACEDIICADCWFHLHKCNFCNKPYCNKHSHKQYFLPDTSGFICEACYSKIERF